MAIRCKDIMKLPSLGKLKLVSGRNGLDNVVRWVHVADVPRVTDWVQGGELLFITGIGLKNDIDALLEMVDSIYKKRLAGLVVNIGPYIEYVPNEVAKYADTLDFPVFELPWEVKIVEVTADICKAIIMSQIEEKALQELAENILFGPIDNPNILINRAAYYGFNLTTPSRVAIIDIDDFANYLKRNKIEDEKRIIEIKNSFQQIVQSVLNQYLHKILYVTRSDSIILIITDIRERDDFFPVLAEDIHRIAARKLPGLTASIGLGNSYLRLSDVQRSFKEAEQAILVINCTDKKNSILSYQEIGFYKLLFGIEEEELISYNNETLGRLEEYDQQHGSDLVFTLQVLLDENYNLTKTTKKLFIHRNTLKYRIQKIESITGLKVEEPGYHRLNLQLSLAIRTFVKSLYK